MDIHQLPPGAVLIGRGKQGSVYKLSSDRCVKLYNHEKYAQLEAEAYRRAEGSPIIPKLYDYGPKYLVMEFIPGDSLKKILAKRRTITRSDVEQIIFIFHEMMRLGFTRLDTALFHIYIREGESSKIIDLVHSYKRQYPYPKVMLKGLARLDVLAPFLRHLQELDPALYQAWMEHIKTRSDRYGNLLASDK